ncbi:hypothetical protein AVEN_264018-1 [Araneus ventricosus]|uniref:Uncharacterized protein n=1 Tax=Araneus ventricosus TaxID=182803 RepID=A0A4Y2K3Q0_ARAVE|nr:hypothetical protein AVEN_264018-1 [Araneus ventricosus]
MTIIALLGRVHSVGWRWKLIGRKSTYFCETRETAVAASQCGCDGRGTLTPDIRKQSSTIGSVTTLTHGSRPTREGVRLNKDYRGEENQPQPPEGHPAPRTAFI